MTSILVRFRQLLGFSGDLKMDKRQLETDSTPNLPGDFGDDEFSQWLEMLIDFEDLSEEGRKRVSDYKIKQKRA
jgi:hypothetical protein